MTKSKEVNFWLSKVPRTGKDEAEKARKERGHNKKVAMRIMIALYLANPDTKDQV